MGVENAPKDATLRLSLLAHALKRGIWLLGLGIIVASFLLQAVALHLGSLSQVQPILTAELVFLVFLLATWFRFRIGISEWIACIAAAGGLAGFLVFAEPVGGNLQPTLSNWIITASVCGGVILAMVALALRGPRWWRAAMFGAAGAVGFALTASFIKTVGDYVAIDWTQMFGHWQTYASGGLWSRIVVSGTKCLSRRAYRFVTDRPGTCGPVGQHCYWHRPLRGHLEDLGCLRPSRSVVAAGDVQRSRLHRPLKTGVRHERRQRTVRRNVVYPVAFEATGWGGSP